MAPAALSNPIQEGDPILHDIQANWIKGHGRDHTVNAFFRFTGNPTAFLTSLFPLITWTDTQLAESKEFKLSGTPGGAVILVFLSGSGYGKLGVDQTLFSPEFVGGIKARQQELSDPVEANWDPNLQGDIDALVIVADDNQQKLDVALIDVLQKAFAAGVTPIALERGIAIRNNAGEGLEHFGYVDGRSQPLFYQPDIEKEISKGTGGWDFVFPPEQFLHKDAGGNILGSYFVWRKLEQNVKAFKTREQELANELNFVGEKRELAGGFAVGRFEDGTPVILHEEAQGGAVPNNFDYTGDPDGRKCPYAAHIRKTNPRTPGRADHRTPIMARRGITYGIRTHHPQEEVDLDRLPIKDVGLLFQAYMSTIAGQFEVTQRFWANNPNFENPNVGIDPVIGQGGVGDQTWPEDYNGDVNVKFDFAGFVTFKGGEYLHAPSRLIFSRLGIA